MSALTGSGNMYGIRIRYVGRYYTALDNLIRVFNNIEGRPTFRVLEFDLTTDTSYINQLYEELEQLFPPETIIPPNTPKPFDHFDYDAILYAPKKRIPTWVSDDATRYLQIQVHRNQVSTQHGQNKNLEALDTILVHTSLFPKLQAYLVKSGHAETLEKAGKIIKEEIAPLARTIAPLVKV